MKQTRTYGLTIRNLIIFFMIICLSIPAIGQSEKPKKQKTRHRVSYMNQADSVKYLKSYLYVSEKGKKTEIEGATIQFLILTDSGEVVITEVVTDATGNAVGLLPADMDLPADTSGLYSFVARFEGDEEYKAKEADIAIKDLHVKTEFLEEDSTRFIKVKATDPKSGDRIEDIDVGFYVERWFFPLKIGEGTTNSKGIVELEFPDDLPGDADGNISVLIRIEDDDTYGNYEAAGSVNWGIPLHIVDTSHERALWSPYAPMWMVVTFILLMLIAWGHYAAIIAMLVNIWRKSDDQKSELEWES